METKKLALSVEWENGTVSNEVQAGVKPKYIILENGEKLPVDMKGPHIISPQVLKKHLKEIDQTLIGLGQCQSELASWYWRRHSEAETWNFNTQLSGTRPVLSLGSLLD